MVNSSYPIFVIMINENLGHCHTEWCIPESTALPAPLGDDVLDRRGVLARVEKEGVFCVREDLSQAIDVAGKLAAAVDLAPAAGDPQLRHSRRPVVHYKFSAKFRYSCSRISFHFQTAWILLPISLSALVGA